MTRNSRGKPLKKSTLFLLSLAAVFPHLRQGIAYLSPSLAELWEFLESLRTLGDVADIHRGIEWSSPLRVSGRETGNRDYFVRSSPATGYRIGLAPKTRYYMFVPPNPAYLNVKPEEQRVSAYKLPWGKPKVILNQGARQRGKWKLAAFPDRQGWVCPQSFFGVWPRSNEFDEIVLSAILNSPIANALVAACERVNNIRKKTLNQIPVPYLTEGEAETIRERVKRYQDVVGGIVESADASGLLKMVDAAVLDCYRLPAKMERQLLDSFRGFARPVLHDFPDYYESDDETWFNLSQYLSTDLQGSTAAALAAKLASDR